jgi:carboxyl-terminal processing protease
VKARFYLGLALAFLAGRWSGQPALADPYSGLSTLARVLTDIGDRYVEEIPQERLIYAGLEGMMVVLDRHTAYFSPSHWAKLRVDAQGEFAGAGVECTTTAEGLKVDALVRGGPAELAGVKVGDRLVAINGVALASISPVEADKLLNGEPGSVGVWQLIRGEEPLELVVAQLRLSSLGVQHQRLGAAGVLSLRSFRGGTAAELDAHLKQLTGVQGLVLDLRNNPGGLLEEGVAVADRFLSEGLIVRASGRSMTGIEKYAEASSQDWTIPLVVLINKGTASAAEVVAGALQLAGRAVLVGEQSYGKGTVQTILHYPDGSAMKLTIGRYSLRDGRSVEGRGLSPEVLVAGSEPGKDVALEAALKRLAAMI